MIPGRFGKGRGRKVSPPVAQVIERLLALYALNGNVMTRQAVMAHFADEKDKDRAVTALAQRPDLFVRVGYAKYQLRKRIVG